MSRDDAAAELPDEAAEAGWPSTLALGATSVRWGLVGLKVARAGSELASAAVSLTSRAGFGLGETLAAGAGVAAERAAVRLTGDGTQANWLAPVLTSVVVPAAAQAVTAFASAKEFTAAGIDLGRQTFEYGLSGAERLLADSTQVAQLAAALPRVAAIVRRFAADTPDASTPALMQALYALSCIQVAGGPVAPPARAVCDACALEPHVQAEFGADEVAEIRRLVRYAVGAYGGAALAVLSAASVRDISAAMRFDNRAGTAARLGIAVADIVLEGEAGVHRPAHFVALDHCSRRIVVSLRGTVNVLDSLTNLQCGTAMLSDGSGLAHEGMLNAALELAAGPVGAAVAALTVSHPDYELRVTGHSQGAGVAALLVHHWRRRYPTVRGYVFAPPCILTLNAARALAPCCTSIVFGDDMIPRLSLGSIADLRNAAAAIASEPRLCSRIHAAIAVGSEFPDIDDLVPPSPVAEPADGDADGLWMLSLRTTLHAVMQSEKLFPPGRVLWMPAVTSPDGVTSPVGTVRWADPEQFSEIALSATMWTTHLPHTVESAVLSVFAADDTDNS